MLADWLLPLGYTLFAWWFSTGVILYLDGLPRRTFPNTMAVATLLLGMALWALAHTRDDTSGASAYCAFTCALLVWAWQEVAFLLGLVTGPRKTACPSGAVGWRRARFALEAVLWHEGALLLLAMAVLACVGGGANRVGLWTFMALWAMRQSAKLNIFLGVRNLGESFLPAHLQYLKSYFQRRPMNVLFPFSVTAGTASAAWLLWPLLEAATSAHQATGLRLVGTLLALGALEHWLLVLPLPTEALWRWGLRSHVAGKAAAVATGAATPPA